MCVVCSQCGADDVICYRDPATALCPACCGKTEDGHDFEYERSERQHICQRCGLVRSDDE